MKLKETILLLTLLVCTNLQAMEEQHTILEENINPNIIQISDNLKELSLEQKSLPQSEIKDILTILAMREKVIHCMIERCKIETNTHELSQLSFQKLEKSKVALFAAFNEAEIYYSEANKRTQSTIDSIDKSIRSEVINFFDYNFIKPIISNTILLNENKSLQMCLNKGSSLFQKKKLFLEACNNITSIQYKTKLAKIYEKYYKKLALKKEVAQTIFRAELSLNKISQKEQSSLFNILFNIHILHLQSFIKTEVDKKTLAIAKSSESRLKKKLLQKEFAAIRTVLKKRLSTTIELEIEKITALSLPSKIVGIFAQMLSTKKSLSEKPSYLVYLKYLYNKSEKLVPTNLLQQHSQNTVSLIIKHASLLELLLSAIPNSHETIKNIFGQQQEVNPPKTQKKKQKRNRKRRKKSHQQSVAIQKNTAKSKQNTTQEDNHLTKKVTPKTNRKRNRKRKKKKSGITTPDTCNNQPANKIQEDANVTEQKAPQQPLKPTQPFDPDEDHMEDIIHINNEKHACLLDLIRFNGRKNKIFIPKSFSPLPYNPLKNIIYSKHVLENKMSHENDNNHAFSPLVRKFGQHGYIKDQELTSIQKKALGTKHHIQNSTQYTLQHTVYLPARIASLGYPVEHFEKNGCTPNGEFEFTFVRKDKDDHGICIHRFFRPYS